MAHAERHCLARERTFLALHPKPTRIIRTFTRKPQRLATLLLLGALACHALWLMGLALRSSGYRIEFGSRKKALHVLSVVSLARWWMMENKAIELSWRQCKAALALFCSMVMTV